MNKDFWERVNKLEELAIKATQEEWYTEPPQRYNIEFRAAANPATILEMIAVFKGRLSFLEHELVEKDIELENTKAELKRLEKEADGLSEMIVRITPFLTTKERWRKLVRESVGNK